MESGATRVVVCPRASLTPRAIPHPRPPRRGTGDATGCPTDRRDRDRARSSPYIKSKNQPNTHTHIQVKDTRHHLHPSTGHDSPPPPPIHPHLAVDGDDVARRHDARRDATDGNGWGGARTSESSTRWRTRGRSAWRGMTTRGEVRGRSRREETRREGRRETRGDVRFDSIRSIAKAATRLID